LEECKQMLEDSLAWMLDRDESFLPTLTFEVSPSPKRPPQDVVGRVKSRWPRSPDSQFSTFLVPTLGETEETLLIGFSAPWDFRGSDPFLGRAGGIADRQT